MRAFRFELAFDGEPQGVGFLQGLNETGIPIEQLRQLYKPFDELPVPDIDTTETIISFWFTEAGLAKFSKAIDNIAQELAEISWQVIEAELDIDCRNAIYQDSFQIAFPIETVRCMRPKFNPMYKRHIIETDAYAGCSFEPA